MTPAVSFGAHGLTVTVDPKLAKVQSSWHCPTALRALFGVAGWKPSQSPVHHNPLLSHPRTLLGEDSLLCISWLHDVGYPSTGPALDHKTERGQLPRLPPCSAANLVLR